MLQYKHTEKAWLFFQGEAHTPRAMFRVSKTAKIKKKGMLIKIWDNGMFFTMNMGLGY